ncbi:unnamed protein product [Symbiodinium necroappetens]|uniref:Uncharacterized protein n=1 Tax=Symbiodinium necroappetens TaxID=1628268 RepID=A0A812MAE3_9DINO|nr:unnamed protein product [Symbiodinium necroappetens]
MSAWQQRVFDEVARRASEQSRAAEPKLLHLLDSGDFRSHLSKCCPSLVNLPSEELMERLSKQLEVAEVCSGFPAMHDPSQTGDSAGMSISFGLTGSFFLNDWEAVLLHSANPHSVWHKIEATYVAYSVDSTLQEVLVKKWFGGCSGVPLPQQRYSLNECYGTADQNFVMRFTAASGISEMVSLSIWTAIHQTGASDLESPAGTRVVPCPSRLPLVTQVHVADGECHIHVRKNNTEAFLMQDRAETIQYELKPFRMPAAPATLIEAGERPVYSMVNLNMIDAGSPLYGDVSAVFSNKHILNSTLLSSVDSGFFQQYCINGKTFPRLSYNCSAETAFEGLGTFLHNRHLFVNNMEFWKSGGTVQSAFQRGQLPWGSSPVPGHLFLNYLEATHLSKLHYPEAIRFLIGTFPVLFGTELGANLQIWAKSRGWVLVWALGLNDKALLRPTRDFDFSPLLQDVDFKVNGRMVDPIVLGHTTATVGPPVQLDVVNDFEKLWAEVGAVRGQTKQLTNQTVANKWQQAMLHFPQLLLRPLLGEDCTKQLRHAECVGVTLDGGTSYAPVSNSRQVGTTLLSSAQNFTEANDLGLVYAQAAQAAQAAQVPSRQGWEVALAVYVEMGSMRKVATTPVATPVATPATAAPNPPRGVSAPSATPSECSTVVRHGQFNTTACDEATDDSDPDVSSWHGRGQQQSLQDVLAFLDQKEREVSMIFSKTRNQLLQAMPMPPSTDGSGSAVTARSDEATVRWREFGEPFYRAISLQRQREKENQTLREMVALKKLELEKLLTALRAGSQTVKAVEHVGPSSETEGSPLAGSL